jgi:Protein of unknown function (DUF3592)
MFLRYIGFVRLICFIPAWFAVWIAFTPWMGMLQSMQWTQADAVVQIAMLQYSSGSKGKGKGSEQLLMTYTYEWQGKQYSGSRPTLDSASDTSGSEWLRKYIRAPGSLVQVWLNPKQPGQSVVNRDINTGSNASAWLAALAFGAAAWWLGRWGQSSSQHTQIASYEEPGRVQETRISVWGGLSAAALLLVVGLAYQSNINAFAGGHIDRAQRAAAKESKSALAQTQQVIQTLPAHLAKATAFELQDSGWLFTALGRGTVSAQTNSWQITSEGLRLQYRGECPSTNCTGIKSLQWHLAELRTELQDGKPKQHWNILASSQAYLISFQPTSRNDQTLWPAQTIQLNAVRTGEWKNIRVLIALQNVNHQSTYSASQPVMTTEEKSGALQPQAASQNPKALQSLYGALFYADAAATQMHLSKDTSVHERYENDMGAAHVAAFSGCAECIAHLAKAGADLNQAVSGFRKERPLMTAIRTQQVAAAIQLLASGADPCLTDREGYTSWGWVQFYKLEASFDFVPRCGK